MTFSIIDGEGSNRRAGVDTRFRLKISSIVETESNFAIESGNKFNVNTGDITITNATKLSVLYIKNNDNRTLIIDALFYNTGTSTGGTGDHIFDIIRNPKTGQIITAATNVQIGLTENANFNFGSSQTLNVLAYKGTQGQTVFSDGGLNISTRKGYTNQPTNISPGGSIYLPKGASLGINYTPPTGNTSMIVQFGANGYFKS